VRVLLRAARNGIQEGVESSVRVSIVTDEVSRDVLTACELAAMWGIRHVDLKSLRTGRVPDIDEPERRELRQALEHFGLDVLAISPGLFKIPWDSPQREQHRRDRYARSAELAHELGATRMLVFSFEKPGPRQIPAPPECPSYVIETLHEAAEKAQHDGLLLVLENEATCWGDTGANAAAIVRRVNHPALRLNWDPGNSVSAGVSQVYPHDFRHVRGQVSLVHFKADRRTAPALWPGSQLAAADPLPWEAMLRELRDGGFDGHIAIETHARPKVRCSLECWEALKQILTVLGEPIT
jgi:sugar phosphate isomerase/epimerase